MAGRRELLRIWARRLWRRRWLALEVIWAICMLGWAGVGVFGAGLTAAAAGTLFCLVLLAGATAAGLTVALVERRTPVFDSVAELRGAFRHPVLGSVADLSAGSWERAASHIPFAVGCGGLIALCAGLLIARALG